MLAPALLITMFETLQKLKCKNYSLPSIFLFSVFVQSFLTVASCDVGTYWSPCLLFCQKAKKHTCCRGWSLRSPFPQTSSLGLGAVQYNQCWNISKNVCFREIWSTQVILTKSFYRNKLSSVLSCKLLHLSHSFSPPSLSLSVSNATSTLHTNEVTLSQTTLTS